MHDLPILIFTILLTVAIGLAGYLALVSRWLEKDLPVDRYRGTLLLPMIVATMLGAVALAVSFAHLGYPLNAVNAGRNIATSWLSREGLLAGGFIGLMGLTALWALWRGPILRPGLLAAFAVGLLAVVAMGELYRTTSVVTWMHPNTHVMFFGGLLILGALAGLLLIVPRVSGELSAGTLRRLYGWTGALVLAGLAAQIVVLPFYLRPRLSLFRRTHVRTEMRKVGVS